jgi:hypothetical protein
MVEVKVDKDTRLLAYEDARKMGKLDGSLTRGNGNNIGMLGERIVHRYLGGERVGDTRYSCDIVLPDGRTVDVKTGAGRSRPEPHYAARIYASEDQREKLAHKCDCYFFVRCSPSLTQLWLLGWLPADEFANKASFHPRGSRNPEDGRTCRTDEFVVPVSGLRPPQSLRSR